MDYLDPKKELKHRITLMIGYVLVAVAIVIATLVLLYQAYGFGIGKNGTVIQSGLVFFSSQPNPANIYLNNALNKKQTNARLVLPAGIYHTKLTRDGYRDWQRTIEVEGGDVQHFDYPFFIPTKLTSKKIASYEQAPGLATQSPDRRWLLVQDPGSMANFKVFDLKSPDKAPTPISLPSGVLTKAGGAEKWQLEEWADDNNHVVLEHDYDSKIEYVEIDRSDPAQSLNIDAALGANPAKLTLLNKKYDQFYLSDAAGTLQTVTLSDHTPKTVLQNVLNYQSYGSDSLLYATNKGAAAGQVLVKLKVGDTTYPVHNFVAGSTYLLDLTKYSGTLYVVAGASAENKAYIYKDPVGQLSAQPNQALVPSQVLHVNQPNFVSFSTSTQFIMLENSTRFGVYDIENTKGYNYNTASLPLDVPQTHATWMDGNRMTYVSGGKVVVFDYDGTNRQALVPASPAYLPAFAPDYKFLYTFTRANAAANETVLNQTSLLSPADQ